MKKKQRKTTTNKNEQQCKGESTIQPS